MEIFLSSISVVVPLFVMMLVGWLLRRGNLISDAGISEMNKLVARVFLPLMLFSNGYASDIGEAVSPKFFTYSLIVTLVLYVLLMVLVPRFEKEQRRKAALVLSVFRPNTAIYGLPIAEGILGDATAVSNVVVMISFIILISNFLGVLAIEIFKGEKVKPGVLLLRSLSNPILWGVAAGMLLQLLPFRIPAMLLSPIKSIGSIATPLAFIILGAGFTLKSCKKNAKPIAIMTTLKLVVTPMIIIPLGVWLCGFRGAELVALLCAFATPTAVSVVSMVHSAGGDDELLGEIVVFSTGFSILTIFGFTYVFKLLGYF